MRRSLRSLWLALPLVAHAAAAPGADVTVSLDAGDGFSVRNSGGAVERLRVDEATGNVSRNGALFLHTTGAATNTFVGATAGNPATMGSENSAFGMGALRFNAAGSRNSAFGYAALLFAESASDNSAFGHRALLSAQAYGNSAFGSEALRATTVGKNNSAFGWFALQLNDSGQYNAAFGAFALRSSNASANSAFGVSALTHNTTGSFNAAFGFAALGSSAEGVNNSAFGGTALKLATTGSQNSAFGRSALYNNTMGSNNIAVGNGAGFFQTTGSNNIYLANQAVAGESGQIKIGIIGTHTQATIAGIHGATSAGGIGVYVNGSGALGTNTSSVRFKDDVRDMAGASDVLLKLRPVVFRYKQEAVGAERSELTQYGLIAEEVAEVAPELVAPDTGGRPYSVRYHELAPMLVNEVQKQRRENEAQERTIAALEARVREAERPAAVDARAAIR